MSAHELCKICSGQSPLLDVIDFNRTCEEARGIVFPLAGIPVWYRRCSACGFVFSNHADTWSPAEFEARIYNEEYRRIDPDFAGARPRFFLERLQSLFGDRLRPLRILDYGAGDGALVDLMRGAGLDAVGYDPYSRRPDFRQRPTSRFDLVLAFEVFEHSVDPKGLVQDMAQLLDPQGLLLFSTTLNDGRPLFPRLAWPYAAPRNGHFSLYSAHSLDVLFAGVGRRVGSFDSELHAAFGEVPDFARHVVTVAETASAG